MTVCQGFFRLKTYHTKMIEDYINYYNTKWLQRKLGILTPMEKHEQFLLAA